MVTGVLDEKLSYNDVKQTAEKVKIKFFIEKIVRNIKLLNITKKQLAITFLHKIDHKTWQI